MLDKEQKIRSYRLVMLIGELSKAHGTLIRVKNILNNLDFHDSNLVQKADEMIEEINSFDSILLLAADASLAEPSQGNDPLQAILDT